jgi:hypothetical protein
MRRAEVVLADRERMSKSVKAARQPDAMTHGPDPARARNHWNISPRIRVRIAGILFLAAFVAYGGGNALAAKLLVPGGILMLANSAMVIAIGFLLYPVLEPYDGRVARGYLITRIVEGSLLAAGVVCLLAVSMLGSRAATLNFYAYESAMAVLGFGSLFFCHLLYRRHLVPGWLAIAGLVGYAVFLAGAVLELAGYRGGLILSIPGGLFELVFGTWLIVKGLSEDGT